MGRRVEFIPDGVRVRVSPRDVALTWALYSPSYIPAQYALGTGQHETDFTLNERDTEPSGFVSMGLYQISSDEMAEAGLPDVDPYSLDGVTRVFANVSQKRVDALAQTAALRAPPYPDDLFAFLSIAHNQGLGAAIKSIKLHGLDWGSYQRRNLDGALAALARARQSGDQGMLVAAESKLEWWNSVFAYGSDCISGGSRWGEVGS